MSCQIKNLFSVAYSPVLEEAICEIDLPTEIRLALNTDLEVQVNKGSAVLHGDILATSAVVGQAALVSPVAGKVQSVDSDFIVIKVDASKVKIVAKETKDESKEELLDKNGEASKELATEVYQFDSVESVDLQSFSKEELFELLPSLGFDVSSFASAKTVVINALEVEPDIFVHAALLREESKVLFAGLGILQKMAAVIFALPKGYSGEFCRFEHFFHPPFYPFCLDAFVSQAVQAEKSAVLSLSALYRLGKIALTGLACNHTVMSIFGRNYRILHGTPVLHILQSTGKEVYPEDRLVLGGAFRGRCLFNPGQGTQPDDLAVIVVHQKDFPETQDVGCLNCGECVLACPVGLMPNLLSRYAEYNLFEQDLKHGIHFCVECGLCSYFCIAQRPVLQYIQMAKTALQKAELLPKIAG